jgi:hypothetical protein
MIKSNFAFLFFFLLNLTVKAQLIINNSQITIQSGASVIVQGDVISNSDILGDGKVVLKGTASQNFNMGGKSLANLEIDNSNNAVLVNKAIVVNNLNFTNGKLQLGNNNLVFASSATITNAGINQYVVTDGNGKIIKANLNNTAFSFPVGNSNSTYNPISISNSGSPDSIGVRCLSNIYSNGLTGISLTKDAVDASWDISETVAGGSNLTVTTSWNASDELPGFNRNKGGISNYLTSPAQNTGWDLLNNQTGSATGTGPFTYTRNNINTLGAFAVGSSAVLSPLLVSPKIFLQGNYSNGLMTESLRTQNLIPTTEPYSGITGFTHIGSGGGESTLSSIVGSNAPSDNNSIVDWVFLQLHQATDSNIISTRSVLLQRDGDVVDIDGISPVNMSGNASGNYFISVRHRNHIGARTSTTLSLAKTTTSNYNMTDGLNKVFKGSITHNPLATLSNGVFGLWAGNANNDGLVKMTGLTPANNDYLKLLNTLESNIATQTAVYSNQDLNLDGNVKMTGLTPDNNDYLRILNTLGTSTSSLTQPSF